MFFCLVPNTIKFVELYLLKRHKVISYKRPTGNLLSIFSIQKCLLSESFTENTRKERGGCVSFITASVLSAFLAIINVLAHVKENMRPFQNHNNHNVPAFYVSQKARKLLSISLLSRLKIFQSSKSTLNKTCTYFKIREFSGRAL